jgi:glycosyltransferase involved in cell wall biosynthesis
MGDRSQKTRIVMLIDHLTSGGGAQSIVADIVDFGERGRFDYSVAYCFGESAYTEKLRSAEATEYFLGCRGSKWLSWFHALVPYRLVRLIRHLRPGILHVHAFTVPLLHGALCRGLFPGMKIVYTQHCSRCQCSRFWRWWQRVWMRRYHVVATDLQESCVEAREYGVAAERIRWIPFGVRVWPVSPAEVEYVRQEIGWQNGDRVLLSVARLEKDRHIDAFIRAMPAILSSDPRCKLILVGGGREEARLRQLTNELSVCRNITFLGPRSDPMPYYNACDLYLTMAIGREIGVAGWQATLCGKPVVAIVSDHAKDTEPKGARAFLDVRTVEDLAATVVGLVSSERERHILSESGRRYALENHRPEAMAERYTKLYGELLEDSHDG